LVEVHQRQKEAEVEAAVVAVSHAAVEVTVAVCDGGGDDRFVNAVVASGEAFGNDDGDDGTAEAVE
jgi:hypothetical protein